MSEDGRFTMDITSQTDLSDVYDAWAKLTSYMDRSIRDKLITNNPIAALFDQKLDFSTLFDSGTLDALGVKVRTTLQNQIDLLTAPNHDIKAYTPDTLAEQSNIITTQFGKSIGGVGFNVVIRCCKEVDLVLQCRSYFDAESIERPRIKEGREIEFLVEERRDGVIRYQFVPDGPVHITRQFGPSVVNVAEVGLRRDVHCKSSVF